jgi:hypothetical protein
MDVFIRVLVALVGVGICAILLSAAMALIAVAGILFQ